MATDRGSPFTKNSAWLLLGLAAAAAVLYTVGIVIGNPSLILIGMVVTIALYFLLRSRSKRQARGEGT